MNDQALAYSKSDFYQLIATSLYIPTEELTEAFSNGSYQEDVMAILQELSCSEEDLTQVHTAFQNFEKELENTEYLLRDMKIENTRLFYDPKTPVIDIYETTFTKDNKDGTAKPMLFVSKQAVDVEKCYKEAGLNLKTNDPADHIVTELEFMMSLYAKKGHAIEENNEVSIKKIEEQITYFEKEHIGKWAIDFFEKVETESKLAAYQLIGKIGKLGLSKIL